MKYSNLDVIDINSIIFVSKEKQPSLPKQIGIFFAQLLYYSFIRRFKYKPIPEHYKGIVFLGVSINNQRSLDPIIEHLNEGEYLYLKNHKTDIHKRRAYWLSIPYLFDLIKTYKKADESTKPTIKRYFTRLWSTYGYYQLAKEYLEQYKVKVLIVSSDQGEFQRCLLMNSNELKIKTIYVQHASVSKGFPRLIATYSFLDGQESLDKYLFSGQPKGEVYLSGGVRFDPIFQKYKPKKNEKVGIIGVAINMLDDFESVKALCNTLLHHGFRLIIRPHPRYGGLNRAWLQESGIGFSDPQKETSFDFIDKIDMMVSNESAIHIDAALMSCPSVVYNFSVHPIIDHYAYIKKGLVKVAGNEEQLLYMINHPQTMLPSKNILQYYNASCETQMEGHLGETIAEFIETNCVGSNVKKDFPIQKLTTNQP